MGNGTPCDLSNDKPRVSTVLYICHSGANNEVGSINDFVCVLKFCHDLCQCKDTFCHQLNYTFLQFEFFKDFYLKYFRALCDITDGVVSYML